MRIRHVLTVAVLAAVVLAALAAPAFAAGAPVRKIVVFRSGFLSEPALGELTKRGATVVKRLPLIDGAAVYLPSEAAARALARDVRVLRVDDDIVVQALGKPSKGGGTQPAEVQPWGIGRVGAPLVWPLTVADPVRVGIIDTGIDFTHPDLADNIKGGASFVGYTTSYKDDNGHGTHVAGIVAAVDNEIGVIGVAPSADLYGIKVLNRQGSGYLSDIIEGLDWAVANGIDVVNMSLGTNTYSQSFDQAVQRTISAGVVTVAAAGNDGPGTNTVDYPGAFANVIAVGATDSNDAIASWSSRGPQVTVSAPGVSVRSTYKGGGYQTLSGTSMATPHVAGTVALMLTQPDPGLDGWQPAEVKAKLQATALDLGTAGFDTAYGAGLVRANLAVAP